MSLNQVQFPVSNTPTSNNLSVTVNIVNLKKEFGCVLLLFCLIKKKTKSETLIKKKQLIDC